jgi:phospholipase D1/2
MKRASNTILNKRNKKSSLAPAKPILAPGRNCWRIARADRFALIVDAAQYFRELRRVMIKAERSIMMIGWDFDLRIRLDPEDREEWPARLGRLIRALVKRKRKLEVRLLKWDLDILRTIGRGATPFFMLSWLTDRRITLKLDGAHPSGASHHQKIVAVDDALAFCGGIDVTTGRWDTRKHLKDDKRRRSPWGFEQGPWHDATTAVSGEAARVLGELARDRWQKATNKALEPPAPSKDLWPETLHPMLEDVDVAIARTLPEHNGERGAYEIETLYLDAIRSARRTIYIESQYLACRAIAEAIAERLEENGGPEVIIVNPKSAEGWLEETAMGPARAVIVSRLKSADKENRFRLYCPISGHGEPIYVHAKIMIVDDRFLKVGSSNLNNRSMGLDTECDLAIEAVPGHPDEKRVGAAIKAVMDDLLAEHLDAPVEAVAQMRRQTSSSIAVIDQLSKADGHRLVELKIADYTDADLALAESRLLDPERPRPLMPRLRRFFRKWFAGSRARPRLKPSAEHAGQ